MSVRVYKVGGPALEDPGLITPLAEEVRRAEGQVVLVHGGGRAVDRLLKELRIESRFVEGRRETSPEAMAVVEMVLSGTANKQLAAGLTAAGVPAVGISGRDGGLVRARLHAGARARRHSRACGSGAAPRALDAGSARGVAGGERPAAARPVAT